MRRIILAAAGALIACLFLEIGIRAVDGLRGSHSGRLQILHGSSTKVPRIFCQFRPPPGGAVPSPGGPVAINSLGMRGRDAAREKPPGTFRILCLGGSTTFDAFNGAGVHWPGLLEDRLRAQFPNRQIEVLNAGVNGWSSAHSLAYLAFDGLALSPDAVIVYHNVNDLSVNFHGEPEPDYANKYDLPEWDPRPERHMNAADRLFGWSEGYLWLRLKLRQAFQRGRRVEVKPYDAARGLPAAPQFRRNLDGICAIAQAGGADVYLGLQAQDIARHFDGTVVTQLGLGNSVCIPSAKTYLEFQRRYNEIVRETATRRRAGVVDADRALSEREDLFVDTCHTNAKGSAELAEVFRAALAPKIAARFARTASVGR